jgi:uncharacterized protein YigA (DUF484 family)
MTDDSPDKLALAFAELDRLRERGRELEVVIDGLAERIEAAITENHRLRARILELEAELAITHGTLAQPTLTPDGPATIVHDVPPNAPR